MLIGGALPSDDVGGIASPKGEAMDGIGGKPPLTPPPPPPPTPKVDEGGPRRIGGGAISAASGSAARSATPALLELDGRGGPAILGGPEELPPLPPPPLSEGGPVADPAEALLEGGPEIGGGLRLGLSAAGSSPGNTHLPNALS